MTDLFTQIAAAIGAIVTIGGGLVYITYQVFKALGSKWLEQQFAKQLEAFKHEQQVQIEHLRHRINSIFDRTVRLHQAEFEVLPEAWSRLYKSFHNTRAFVAWISSEPDLDAMNAAHLDEFLASSPLMAWQREELRNAKNKTTDYSKAMYFHRLHDIRNDYYEFNRYLMTKGVFLPPEIDARFHTLSDIVWEAIIEKQAREEVKGMGGPLQTDKRDRLNDEGMRLMNDLRTVVQNLLRDSKLAAETNASGTPSD